MVCVRIFFSRSRDGGVILGFLFFTAYTTFLNNVVRDEVSRIPRGLIHKVMKRQETVENKIMASVPVLLQAQYDKCKQPSAKSNIAGKNV